MQLWGKLWQTMFFGVEHPAQTKADATSFAPQVFNMIDILEAIRGDVGPRGALYKPPIN